MKLGGRIFRSAKEKGIAVNLPVSHMELDLTFLIRDDTRPQYGCFLEEKKLVPKIGGGLATWFPLQSRPPTNTLAFTLDF